MSSVSRYVSAESLRLHAMTLEPVKRFIKRCVAALGTRSKNKMRRDEQCAAPSSLCRDRKRHVLHPTPLVSRAGTSFLRVPDCAFLKSGTHSPLILHNEPADD